MSSAVHIEALRAEAAKLGPVRFPGHNRDFSEWKQFHSWTHHLAGLHVEIPPTQRPYVWTKRPVKYMLTSLLPKFREWVDAEVTRGAMRRGADGRVARIENDSPLPLNYLDGSLGSILTFYSGTGRRGRPQVQVFDGQQRIITFVCLLVALEEVVNNTVTCVADVRAAMALSAAAAEWRLETAFAEDQVQLDLVLARGEAAAEMQRGRRLKGNDRDKGTIVDAFVQLRTLLTAEIAKLEFAPEVWAEFFTTKIHVSEMRCSTVHTAWSLFETINNGGLKLSPAVLLRNQVHHLYHIAARETGRADDERDAKGTGITNLMLAQEARLSVLTRGDTSKGIAPIPPLAGMVMNTLALYVLAAMHHGCGSGSGGAGLSEMRHGNAGRSKRRLQGLFLLQGGEYVEALDKVLATADAMLDALEWMRSTKHGFVALLGARRTPPCWRC